MQPSAERPDCVPDVWYVPVPAWPVLQEKLHRALRDSAPRAVLRRGHRGLPRGEFFNHRGDPGQASLHLGRILPRLVRGRGQRSAKGKTTLPSSRTVPAPRTPVADTQV